MIAFILFLVFGMLFFIAIGVNEIHKDLAEANRLKKLELKRLGFSPEEIDKI